MLKGAPFVSIIVTCIAVAGCGGGAASSRVQHLEPLHGPTTSRWIPLPVSIQFPNGRSHLTAENQALLREAARSLRSRPDVERVRVEGHTDSRGSVERNRQLSIARARVVTEFLIGEGAPAHMFEARGSGEAQPSTSDTEARDRALNRRVEFSVLVRRPVFR